MSGIEVVKGKQYTDSSKGPLCILGDLRRGLCAFFLKEAVNEMFFASNLNCIIPTRLFVLSLAKQAKGHR